VAEIRSVKLKEDIPSGIGKYPFAKYAASRPANLKNRMDVIFGQADTLPLL
jgi:hypothetical protein